MRKIHFCPKTKVDKVGLRFRTLKENRTLGRHLTLLSERFMSS